MQLTTDLYEYCELCPRRCGINRYETKGFCDAGTDIKAAKAMLHYWEEPAITDDKGPSGAVFFSDCNLKCIFCQNYKISHEGFGRKLTPEELCEVFRRLQEAGAQNIDLVTPTHYLPRIVRALKLFEPYRRIPVVYNSGGYENPEVIRAVAPYIDFWLPDVKYYSDDLAVRYSRAPGYFQTALSAVAEMIREAKKKEDPQKHVILRHMVLPGCREDSIRLLHALKEELGTENFLLSLMSQYTPFYKASEHKEINRRVTTFEYEKVLTEAVSLGFQGYMQEKTSAKEEYTPVFDLEGLPPFPEI